MYLITFLILVLHSNLFAGELRPGVIRLGTQNWAPYHYFEDDKLVGVGVDALTCVLDKMGQKYEIKIQPWMRAQVNTEMGELDAFFSASHSKKRDKFAIHSKVFINQDWYFFYLKQRFSKITKKEIKNLHVVSARMNSNVLNWLDVNGFKSKGHNATADKLLLLLAKSRIKFYMENEEVFKHALKNTNLSMSSYGKVFNKSHHLGVYFGRKFLKKYPKFLDVFNSHTDGCSRIRN
ncbi:hypothetical protein A9Q84_16630 [Halobacteriovorax marinus]|uniref:Solute-binding protein family 3/N-terminal domain-containing protein n=1 Tax=Halobacteriovorax marinus TaxID=97084 RepID=A0A1Y5F4F4_9BACT|nr:hypothetical protein A9Q84_16630 [Halobacteriovorax marinus]